MSRIYIAADETGNIRFGRGKAPVKYPSSPVRPTKSETLDFIAYLRDKENVTIESRAIHRRTLFNSCTIDLMPIERSCLETIKKAISAEDAYIRVGAMKAKCNCKWKLIPGFDHIYEDDLVEYLISVGFDPEQAEDAAVRIENGYFKRSNLINDRRLSPDFISWAAACHGSLQERSVFQNVFRLDYLEYLHKNTLTADTAFTISSVAATGRYNEYGLLSSRFSGHTSDALMITYRDNYKTIEKEKLITLGELVSRETNEPEVWIRNMNEDSVTVIKRIEGREDEYKITSSKSASDSLIKVGTAGNMQIGIYPGDHSLPPHFHICDRLKGKLLAVALESPEYLRHNEKDDEKLSEDELRELCKWLSEPLEDHLDLGINVTGYEALCILWNQSNSIVFRQRINAIPDYSALPVKSEE